MSSLLRASTVRAVIDLDVAGHAGGGGCLSMRPTSAPAPTPPHLPPKATASDAEQVVSVQKRTVQVLRITCRRPPGWWHRCRWRRWSFSVRSVTVAEPATPTLPPPGHRRQISTSCELAVTATPVVDSVSTVPAASAFLPVGAAAATLAASGGAAVDTPRRVVGDRHRANADRDLAATGTLPAG